MALRKLLPVISFLILCSNIHAQLMSQNVGGLLKYSNRNIALGSPAFSVQGYYNPFDLSGAALGLLEREKDVFFRLLRQENSDRSLKESET